VSFAKRVRSHAVNTLQERVRWCLMRVVRMPLVIYNACSQHIARKTPHAVLCTHYATVPNHKFTKRGLTAIALRRALFPSPFDQEGF
jgi:hypothetical protein